MEIYVNKYGHSHSTAISVWKYYERQLSVLTLPLNWWTALNRVPWSLSIFVSSANLCQSVLLKLCTFCITCLYSIFYTVKFWSWSELPGETNLCLMTVTVPQRCQKFGSSSLRNAVCAVQVNLKNGNFHSSNVKLQFEWEIMQKRNNPVEIALNSTDIIASWYSLYYGFCPGLSLTLLPNTSTTHVIDLPRPSCAP